jgi:regulator of replication initiation timing
MDIAAVYLGGNKEQEQQAFVYELKKQMEDVLTKNIKLETDNEKLRKLRN